MFKNEEFQLYLIICKYVLSVPLTSRKLIKIESGVFLEFVYMHKHIINICAIWCAKKIFSPIQMNWKPQTRCKIIVKQFIFVNFSIIFLDLALPLLPIKTNSIVPVYPSPNS